VLAGYDPLLENIFHENTNRTYLPGIRLLQSLSKHKKEKK
jgi:hypothetical protein